MDEIYWKMYVRFVYNKFYYDAYRSCSSSINSWISAISCLGSAYGIYSWLTSQGLSWLWAIIIGISQFANIIKSYLPFSKRVTASSYFILELEDLLLLVESDWRRINKENSTVTYDEICDLIKKYEIDFKSINHRYVSGDLFKDRNIFIKKAEKNSAKYICQKYPFNYALQSKKMEVK